ncbi:L,D-transpeptidase family protein [Kitasatospora sp. NPDC087315]|uniref:L,D-transpeptidase family protein n=1 Tax=Kitasatospora sp. NPDC087315 TaxID=3364069 RepID=UPI003827AB45
MSGSHRATAYPPYEPMPEPAYGAPQQFSGVYQQPVHPDHGTPRPAGEYGVHTAGAYDAYPAHEDYEAYDQPFEPVHTEPVHTEPVHTEAGTVPGQAGPVADTAPAAVPVEPRAARGHRRKPKKKRHGRAVTAGTALLLAAAAGWYTVGQDSAQPGVTSADGPGPDGVAAPDQPSPAAVPGAQPAADRHTGAPAVTRSEARADGSVAAIPGVGATFTARIPAETTQVVLASGQGRDANKTTVTLWTRTPEGRWLAGESWQGHNANKGWTTDHNEGDLRSPIGVFSLTDAGGRNADPGSRLPYDKDPNFVVSGRGFAGEPLAGSFDYVVAINYNRVPGNSPLDPRRPSGSTKGGGIWIHVDHGGPTHGCVSVPEDKMAELLRTLDPAAHPVIVMGDAASLAV